MLNNNVRSMAETAFNVRPGQRQLFLDDHGIARIENLTRAMHRPAKKGAVIRPNLAAGITSHEAQSAPIWDEERQVFRFWVHGRPDDMEENACSYFESEDGLHWTKPLMRQVEYRGSMENNYVGVREIDSAFACVVIDPIDPDPACRLKAFAHDHNQLFPVASDGITWRKLDCPAIPSWDVHGVSFDPVEKTFIGYMKDAGHAKAYGGPWKQDATAHEKGHPGTGRYGRSVWLATSKDFRNWTEAELAFETDDLDQELARQNIAERMADSSLQQTVLIDPEVYNADVYNMGGPFRYEGLYVAIPAIYHSTGPAPENQNTDGFHLMQLACSRDLRNWQRLGDRKPFIGPSPLGAGAYDLTQIIGPAGPVVRGDELWFYYTGIKYRSRPSNAEPDSGAVCLAVLRRDGFISLDAGSESGTLVTEPFVLNGDKLYVNVDAQQGELQVEVLDSESQVLSTSSPVTGDLLRGEVEWKQGNINGMHGKDVSFRFALKNAQFYSYWFESNRRALLTNP
jgi:hypothetical protein